MTEDQKELFKKLFSLRRDLVSDGFDEALEYIKELYPITIKQFKSGKACWTWTVPQKWTINSARICNIRGETIFDMNTSNMFVSSYSVSVNKKCSREELLAHINTSKIASYTPYNFHFYDNSWSFNLTAKQKESLVDSEYYVEIDSVFSEGFLKTAEWLKRGETDKIFVIAAHLDHPYQANDGLSGVIVGLKLMEELCRTSTKYTYLLLILPETIGSIAWLSNHENSMSNIVGGIFLDMLGSELPFVLQKSYQNTSATDRSLIHGFLQTESDEQIVKYRTIPGNDERQFNSPGVRIPMLYLVRTEKEENANFPFMQYHSSNDDIENVNYFSIDKSVELLLSMLHIFDEDYIPMNNFKGEVFLSGLTGNYTIGNDYHKVLKAMDMIDGTNLISDIAIETGLSFYKVHSFVSALKENGLISNTELEK